MTQQNCEKTKEPQDIAEHPTTNTTVQRHNCRKRQKKNKKQNVTGRFSKIIVFVQKKTKNKRYCFEKQNKQNKTKEQTIQYLFKTRRTNCTCLHCFKHC